MICSAYRCMMSNISSPSVVSRLAASASPGTFQKREVLAPTSELPNQKLQTQGPAICFNKPCNNSDICQHQNGLRTTGIVQCAKALKSANVCSKMLTLSFVSFWHEQVTRPLLGLQTLIYKRKMVSPPSQCCFENKVSQLCYYLALYPLASHFSFLPRFSHLKKMEWQELPRMYCFTLCQPLSKTVHIFILFNSDSKLLLPSVLP